MFNFEKTYTFSVIHFILTNIAGQFNTFQKQYFPSHK